MARSHQKSAWSTVESVDRQRQAVLALADINQQARERLRARLVERQAAPILNGRKFTMRGLVLEIGTNWEFVKRIHDGSAAFGVSPSGTKLVEYLNLGDEWRLVLAACEQVSLPDAMVSLAVFPRYMINLVFDLKKTFIVARNEHQAMMVDVARVFGMTPEEFESAYYGNNALLVEIDPEHDQTGERYVALRAKLDDASLMSDIARVTSERIEVIKGLQSELSALRDQLLAYKEYASEADLSKKLLGRSGALAAIRDSSYCSTERYEQYKAKLAAELERLGGVKKGNAPKALPVTPSPPPPLPPPSVKQILVEELVDATEGAITDALRLAVSVVRHQVVFLMNLPDGQAMRFGRIWAKLTNEIEDLREHLQALYAETPSLAREKLARLQRERASRSLGSVIGPKK